VKCWTHHISIRPNSSTITLFGKSLDPVFLVLVESESKLLLPIYIPMYSISSVNKKQILCDQ
jgi:hypothetical protein